MTGQHSNWDGELSIQDFQATAANILTEMRKVIVGQDDVVHHVLTCVIAGGHALLEGVPGLGKTTLIRTLGQVLDLKFSRIQFTPDLMPSDVTGTNIMEEGEDGRRAFRFQRGPLFANLVLADEINRATPKTQSALLEAMQEKTITAANTTYRLEEPFFVLATQNPLEMEGTYVLPEAQLDRFMLKIDVVFPSTEELVHILTRTTGSLDTQDVQQAANGERIVAMKQLARNVSIPSHVNEYVARIVIASHPEQPSASPLVKQYVRYGSSPRGAQALVTAAKIGALMDGRGNVSFDDIKAVAKPALRHRLLLNFEGQAENINPDTIIGELFEHVHERA